MYLIKYTNGRIFDLVNKETVELETILDRYLAGGKIKVEEYKTERDITDSVVLDAMVAQVKKDYVSGYAVNILKNGFHERQSCGTELQEKLEKNASEINNVIDLMLDLKGA